MFAMNGKTMPRVHIIGHSFVRDVFMKMKGLRPYVVLSSNTVLSQQYRGGARIRDVHRWLLEDKRTFDVVVLDIGTNDVDSTTPTSLSISSLIGVVSMYRTLRPETLMVIMPVVERAVVRYSRSAAEFNEQAAVFNTQVRQQLEEDRGVFVWQHEEHFDLHADGVHLAKSKRGLLAYGNNLVAAVSGACRRWREGEECMKVRGPATEPAKPSAAKKRRADQRAAIKKNRRAAKFAQI